MGGTDNLDFYISRTSREFNIALAKAHAKLVHEVVPDSSDEIILEAASVIMELEERAETAEQALLRVKDQLEDLEHYIRKLVGR